MANFRDNNITIQDVRLIFRNFAGKADQFNAPGNRNFGVVLPADVAQALAKDGWNIKERPPREEGDDPLYYLPVKLKFGGNGRPPRIVLITSKGRTFLTEDLVETLDWAEIQTADITFRPYDWEMRGNTGRTAYVVALYVKVEEDELEQKWGGYEGEPADEPDEPDEY